MLVSASKDCRGVPARIYLRDATYVQDIVAPLGENGRDATLGDLFRKLVPALFDSIREGRTPFLIQGVTPALETPLPWLADHMAYPDNFLHVAVHASL